MVSAAEVRDLQSHVRELLDRVDQELEVHFNALDPVPPQVLKDEQHLLGQLLADSPPVGDYAYGVQYCLVRLSPDMFYRYGHQAIYAAIGSLWLEQGRVSMVDVVTWLREQDLLEDAGGPDYLAHLAGETYDRRRAPGFCDRIIDRYRRRQVIAWAHDVIRHAECPDTPMADVLDRIYRGMQELPRK